MRIIITLFMAVLLCSTASAQWRTIQLKSAMMTDSLNRADTSATYWYTPASTAKPPKAIRVIMLCAAPDSAFVYQFVRYGKRVSPTRIDGVDSASLPIMVHEYGFYPATTTIDTSGLVHMKWSGLGVPSLYRADFIIPGPINFPFQIRGSQTVLAYKPARKWYMWLIPIYD